MGNKYLLPILVLLVIATTFMFSSCDSLTPIESKISGVAKAIEEAAIDIQDDAKLNEYPPELLSPVVGPIIMSEFSSDKWYFNQHKTESIDKDGKKTGTGHIPGGGINHADDTNAWDVNLANDGDAEKYVYAAAPGVVAAVFGGAPNPDKSYGRVLVEHYYNGNKWWSGYLHMKNIRVSSGQSVDENTILGDISGIGKGGLPAYPNHLHFVVYKGSNEDGKLVSFNTTIMERPGILPNTPTPLSPGVSAELGEMIPNLTPVLCWEEPHGIDCYSVAISKYPYGESNIIYTAANLYGNSHQVPTGKLQADQKYRWNLRAWNNAGPSSYSDRLYFQTQASQEKATLKVKVFNQKNEPSYQTTVTVYEDKEPHSYVDSGSTDNNGEITFTVPSGNHMLVASSSFDHFLVVEEVVAPSTVTIDTQTTTKVEFAFTGLSGKPCQTIIYLYLTIDSYHSIGLTDREGKLTANITPGIYSRILMAGGEYFIFTRDVSIVQGAKIVFNTEQMPYGKLKINMSGTQNGFVRLQPDSTALFGSSGMMVLVNDGQELIISTGKFSVGYYWVSSDSKGSTSLFTDNRNNITINLGDTANVYACGTLYSSTSTDKTTYVPDETVIIKGYLCDSYEHYICMIQNAKSGSFDIVNPQIKITNPQSKIVSQTQINGFSFTDDNVYFPYLFTLPDDAIEGVYTVIFSWDTGRYQGMVTSQAQFEVSND